MNLTLDPHIPWALWLPLALTAAALLTGYALLSRRRLPQQRWIVMLALMSLAVMTPLLILLNPTWCEEVPPPPGKPLLTVLVDRSASMGSRDAGEGLSRYQAACAMAAAADKELGKRFEVRIRTFAEESKPVAAEQLDQQPITGTVTDLASAIAENLHGSRPQGQALLILSDGIHNAGAADQVRVAAAKAKTIAVPVYTATLGGPAEVDDLEIRLQAPQELTFLGQETPVAVELTRRGALPSKATLELLLDGKTVDRQEVELPAQGTGTAIFRVAQKQSGLYRYEIRAKTAAKETIDANNSAALLLRVVDQPIRVLLLEGKPYWDTKFLVRTLANDPAVELVSVVRMTEGRFLKRTVTPQPLAPRESPGVKGTSEDKGDSPIFPAEKLGQSPKLVQSPEKLGQSPRKDTWAIESNVGRFLGNSEELTKYQIVILGRDAEAFLTDDALTCLKKWLIRGDGSLVCFRGSPAVQIPQRLGELLPVRWTPAGETRFHVRWTGEGQSLHWLAEEEQEAIGEMPSLATVDKVEGTKYLAKVLATTSAGQGEAAPAVIYQPVGSGRVVVVEGAGMWRWAFLPPQQQKHDEIYGVLWRSLFRWLASNVGLMPSEKVALRTDKVTFSTGENVSAAMILHESLWGKDVPKVELRGDALKQPRELKPVSRGSPGEMYLNAGPLPEGRYTFRVAGEGGKAAATAAFNVRPSLKERLDVRARPNVMARIAEETGGRVLSGRDVTALTGMFDEFTLRSRPPRTLQTTFWDRWWILLGAMTLWGASWGWRRRSGLV